MREPVGQSPWILVANAGSCNGCDIEILATLTPHYDVERFGGLNKGNPRQADIMLVTGAVTPLGADILRDLASQMPDPHVVLATGACAAAGGIVGDTGNTFGGADEILPVDVYLPGCPPRPEHILAGVLKAIAVLTRKRAATAEVDA